jgi:hypothetical protein
MKQTNKDLPAMPVMPFQDKFSGQTIFLTGFTKLEVVALEILKAHITNDPKWVDDPVNQITIETAYKLAEQFLQFFEDENK